MRRLSVFGLFASGFLAAAAHAGPLSHSRLPGESWEESFKRYEAQERATRWWPFTPKETPMKLRVKFEELDLSAVPEWNSVEELTEVFQRARDLRYLEAKPDPNFPRRISWLYPDDGCFARAAMARQLIEDEWGYSVAKLYIFGDLRAETPNHPSGNVTWSWHVVIAARVADTLYVMDPAIEPDRPMTAEEWTARQIKRKENARFTLCNSYSYGANGACRDAKPEEEAKAEKDQSRFLDQEWRRIKWLRRDPERELGEFPPWAAD